MTRPAETVILPSLDELAHEAVRRSVSGLSSPVLLDATAGNGYDAVFLASLLEQGILYAFDIQEAALISAEKRLTSAFPELAVERWPESRTEEIVKSGAAQQAVSACGPCVRLINSSHALLAGHVPPPVHAAMFNLGFLPGSDKRLATQTCSTLSALNSLLPRMAFGGVVTMHLYTGHPGGSEEAEAVLEYASALPRAAWRVLMCSQHNKQKNKEFLVVIERCRLRRR